MHCAILPIGSGRITPFLERGSRMYSQSAHWDSPLALAQVLNLPVKAYMRCNLSALLGVGTRSIREIESVIPVAVATEMSPAKMKGVRNA